MSNHGFQHLPPITAVSVDDFKRFLKARVINHACPACGSQLWAYTGVGEDGVFMGTPMMQMQEENPDGAFVTTGYGRPMAIVGCAHCGFTRFHDMFVVSQWVRSNPKDPA